MVTPVFELFPLAKPFFSFAKLSAICVQVVLMVRVTSCGELQNYTSENTIKRHAQYARAQYARPLPDEAQVFIGLNM